MTELCLENFVQCEQKHLFVPTLPLTSLPPALGAEMTSPNPSGYCSEVSLGLLPRRQCVVSVYTSGEAMRLALLGNEYDLSDGDLSSAVHTVFPFRKRFAITKPTGVLLELKYWVREQSDYRPSPYPDRDAVVAEIKRRWKRKLPLNWFTLGKGGHAEKALRWAGANRFESWDQALEAAGLDPASVRRRKDSPYRDATAVIDEIKQRQRRKSPLNVVAMQKGEHSDNSLYRAGMRHFGSWDAALKAAGIDPYTVKLWRRSPYQDGKAVVAAIKRRNRRKLPLSAVSLLKGEHADTALYNAAARQLGSWYDGVQAAGIDPGSVMLRRHRAYPDRADVIAELKRRKKLNVPASTTAVARGEHTDYALYSAAKRDFGSWNAALLAAGISE